MVQKRREGGREAFAIDSWLFEPSEVANRTVGEVGSALARHHMTRMTNRDGSIWRNVGASIHQRWGDCVGNLLKEAGYDAQELYSRVREEGGRLPYLRGPKILPLWIRMLNEEAGVTLANMDRLPLPVDINVIKATLMLGVLNGRAEGGTEAIEGLKHDCQRVWLAACRQVGYPVIKLDEPLWLLGREDKKLLEFARPLLIEDYHRRVFVGYNRLSMDT